MNIIGKVNKAQYLKKFHIKNSLGEFKWFVIFYSIKFRIVFLKIFIL
jgi:hypothetical protein